MAEEMKSEVAEANATAVEEMEIENVEADGSKDNGGDSEGNGDETAVNGKRGREEEEGGVLKKHKGEKSVEEQRLEKGKVEESGPVRLGGKSFGSGEDMFGYLNNFIHFWPPNLDLNKYEYMVLLDLLKKGHPEPDRKTNGKEIRAFQIRYHPLYKSRCFFLIRDDESVDDFSFRKCVDHLLPLPENMKVKSHGNGGRGRGRGGRGGGGGRGGWSHGKRRN